MAYSFREVSNSVIDDLFDRTVASVIAGNFKKPQLNLVAKDGTFLYYVALKEITFPAKVTAVTLFGLAEVCTLQSCLEISNQILTELSVPPNEQRIQLFTSTSIPFQSALLFFEENGFEYEMSFAGEIVENILMHRVVPKFSLTRRLLQMVGR
jgi:hypothetical protein